MSHNPSDDSSADPSADDRFDEAHSLLQMGDFAGAVDRFSEIIHLCPDLEGAWGNRGYGLYEMGRDVEALADFDQVIALNPGDCFGYGFRALALRNLGRFEEALEAASTAIELATDEEDVPPARLTRGWLFMKAGQYAAACEDLRIYIEKTPDDQCVRPLLQLSERVEELGRKVCVDGPEGRLVCGICQNSRCGYSFNRAPNPDWEEEGGRCAFSHCVETMPQRSGDGPGICPLFGHDCPGGEVEMGACEVIGDEFGGWYTSMGDEDPDFEIDAGDMGDVFTC